MVLEKPEADGCVLCVLSDSLYCYEANVVLLKTVSVWATHRTKHSFSSYICSLQAAEFDLSSIWLAETSRITTHRF